MATAGAIADVATITAGIADAAIITAGTADVTAAGKLNQAGGPSAARFFMQQFRARLPSAGFRQMLLSTIT